MKNIIFKALLFFSSNCLFSQDISGNWSWELQDGKHMTEIILTKNNNSFIGYYSSSFYNGKKIDATYSENEVCINLNKISTNIFEGDFESPSFNGKGQIRIIYIPATTKIKLEILSSEGEYYLPNNVFFE